MSSHTQRLIASFGLATSYVSVGFIVGLYWYFDAVKNDRPPLFFATVVASLLLVLATMLFILNSQQTTVWQVRLAAMLGFGLLISIASFVAFGWIFALS